MANPTGEGVWPNKMALPHLQAGLDTNPQMLSRLIRVTSRVKWHFRESLHLRKIPAIRYYMAESFSGRKLLWITALALLTPSPKLYSDSHGIAEVFSPHYRVHAQLILTYLSSGMRAKEKGQILRVAANMHVYFEDKHEEDGSITVNDISSMLLEKSICATQDYVDTCCQHAAYISGRGSIEDETKYFHHVSATACSYFSLY